MKLMDFSVRGVGDDRRVGILNRGHSEELMSVFLVVLIRMNLYISRFCVFFRIFSLIKI